MMTLAYFGNSKASIPNSKASMPRVLKIAIWVLGILLVVPVCFLAAFGMIYWALGVMCGNEVLQEVHSPDNEYKVVIFERNCGATTNFSTQLSILRASDNLSGGRGNILRLDGHPDWTLVGVTWDTDRSVTVAYFDGNEIYSRKDRFRDFFRVIEVDYQVVIDE